MCDKLVFDLSQEVEGSPNVFIRKDWLNILDNQNTNYQNNQSIIDTSQLSNSNKYMGYRESYFSIPLTLNVTTPLVADVVPDYTAAAGASTLQNAAVAERADLCLGLKNWFGSIIHSFTLDYNGTTIVQQTPFCNMWNSFKLLTTLSYSDVKTMGASIGFYPDTSNSWIFSQITVAAGGVGGTAVLGQTYASPQVGKYVCNNILSSTPETYTNALASIGTTPIAPAAPGVNADGGNYGLTKRISYINYNPKAMPDLGTTQYGNLCIGGANAAGANQRVLGISSDYCNNVYKSYISTQVNLANNSAMIISVMAVVYLKHVHSFFNMIPLLKGIFMKMTMNLNNCSSTVNIVNPGGGGSFANPLISNYTTVCPVGGICPILIPSMNTGGQGLYAAPGNIANPAVPQVGDYIYNLSVGSTILNPINAGILGNTGGALAKSIYLYVPAYTFNPVFEEAYLSNPVKQIKYTDIYQYQVQNINSGVQFNNLITNGIANIKSVLIIPFFSQDNTSGVGQNAVNFQLPSPQYQSPFDPAGSGCTAPMITLGNFNVQISGQNAIYNTQRYTFEEFNNQLYGQFAVNGGLTDGLTSGLIGFDDFQQSYSYYYVNVERMLPVEQSVPKSVQILGTNYSTQKLDLWVFIEYGVEINIDLTTGARV
jgi:hypothetical protein